MNPPADFSPQEFSLNRPARGASSPGLQSFGRFEFKYIVPDVTARALEEELQEFMEIDPFCRDRPSRSYLVRSLYFDDPGFRCYHEKIDGLLHREKFRLRAYDDPGSSPRFLELKGRHHHFSFKHRTVLDDRLCGLIEARRWSALALAASSPVIEQFAAAACRRQLAPQVLVTYSRRPYVSRRDFRFRVTLDRRIQGQATTALDHPSGRAAWVEPGRTVIEIKFEQAVPAWFQRLVAAYELRRMSISKYCRAAEALTLVQNLE